MLHHASSLSSTVMASIIVAIICGATHVEASPAWVSNIPTEWYGSCLAWDTTNTYLYSCLEGSPARACRYIRTPELQQVGFCVPAPVAANFAAAAVSATHAYFADSTWPTGGKVCRYTLEPFALWTASQRAANCQ